MARGDLLDMGRAEKQQLLCCKAGWDKDLCTQCLSPVDVCNATVGNGWAQCNTRKSHVCSGLQPTCKMDCAWRHVLQLRGRNCDLEGLETVLHAADILMGHTTIGLPQPVLLGCLHRAVPPKAILIANMERLRNLHVERQACALAPFCPN